jgi:hypothetical protein
MGGTCHWPRPHSHIARDPSQRLTKNRATATAGGGPQLCCARHHVHAHLTSLLPGLVGSYNPDLSSQQLLHQHEGCSTVVLDNTAHPATAMPRVSLQLALPSTHPGTTKAAPMHEAHPELLAPLTNSSLPHPTRAILSCSTPEQGRFSMWSRLSRKFLPGNWPTSAEAGSLLPPAYALTATLTEAGAPAPCAGAASGDTSGVFFSAGGTSCQNLGRYWSHEASTRLPFSLPVFST